MLHNMHHEGQQAATLLIGHPTRKQLQLRATPAFVNKFSFVL